MIHTLKIPVVQAVFEAAYRQIVKAENLTWTGIEGAGNEFKFGYHVVDGADRKISETKIVLNDVPPHRLDSDMAKKMWVAQHNLRRQQVERLFNEIMGLINGSVTGKTTASAKVFTYTEAELRDRDTPLLAQLASLKDRNSELQLNYDTLMEITSAKINRLQKEVEEGNAAINTFREASAAASAKPIKAKASPKAGKSLNGKAKASKKAKVG